MSLTALARVPALSVRTLWLWLQGTLILADAGDLVIPACQSRTLWAGVTTGYVELRKSKTVIVQPGLLRVQKNAAPAAYRGVLSQKKLTILLDFFLVLLPDSIISSKYRFLAAICTFQEVTISNRCFICCPAMVIYISKITIPRSLSEKRGIRHHCMAPSLIGVIGSRVNLSS